MDPLAGRNLRAGPARWPGDGGGGVILPLPSAPFQALPPSLELVGQPLERKQEFHLTLLDSAQWRAVAAALDEAVIAACFENQDWRLVSNGRYWWVHRPDRSLSTIVVGVDAPALHRFRAQLSAQGVDLEPPTPHVTLYSPGGRGGIGLSGPSQWRERVRAPLRIDWDRARAEPQSDD